MIAQLNVNKKMNPMTNELKKLIAKANKKLEDAKDARSEVMYYIEENYGIDTDYYSDVMEDGCNWCYGLDYDEVRRLIEEKGASDEE